MKPIRKRIRNKESLWIFRTQLMKLYEKFEANLESLCLQHGVEINFWYSPSKIPQPKFLFERVGIDADTLYDEAKFTLRFSPQNPKIEQQSDTTIISQRRNRSNPKRVINKKRRISTVGV